MPQPLCFDEVIRDEEGRLLIRDCYGQIHRPPLAHDESKPGTAEEAMEKIDDILSGLDESEAGRFAEMVAADEDWRRLIGQDYRPARDSRRGLAADSGAGSAALPSFDEI